LLAAADRHRLARHHEKAHELFILVAQVIQQVAVREFPLEKGGRIEVARGDQGSNLLVDGAVAVPMWALEALQRGAQWKSVS
jgi:hypothetical protein